MYEDTKVKRVFNWNRILIISLVIILTITLVIYISTNKENLKFVKETNEISSEWFNENIELLENVGINYFKENDKPSIIGNSITITLEDLIDNDYTEPIIDEHDKTCNINDSYVKLTKNSPQNYNLNTKLVCGKTTDYLNKDLTFDTIASNENVDNSTNKVDNSNITNNTDNVDNSEVINNNKPVIAYTKEKYYKHIKYSDWVVNNTNNNSGEIKIVKETYYFYCKTETDMIDRNKNCIIDLKENSELYPNYIEYYSHYIDIPYTRELSTIWSKEKSIASYTNTGEYIYK